MFYLPANDSIVVLNCLVCTFNLNPLGVLIWIYYLNIKLCGKFTLTAFIKCKFPNLVLELKFHTTTTSLMTRKFFRYASLIITEAHSALVRRFANLKLSCEDIKCFINLHFTLQILPPQLIFTYCKR